PECTAGVPYQPSEPVLELPDWRQTQPERVLAQLVDLSGEFACRTLQLAIPRRPGELHQPLARDDQLAGAVHQPVDTLLFDSNVQSGLSDTPIVGVRDRGGCRGPSLTRVRRPVGAI